MEARDFLADYSQQVKKYLEIFFSQKKKEAVKISPICAQMVELYRDHLRGGKKARGALMFLGYLLAGGRKNKKIYQASLFPEIIQSFLLIHDDVMDQDLIRRGKPTPEAFYTSLSQKKKFSKKATHFGLSMAIDLGDLGMFLAQEALCQSGFKKEKILNVLGLANQVYQKVAYGQALDIFGEASGQFSQDYVFQIHLFKTAEYSVSAPLKFGALLAGAEGKFLNLLDRYGQSIGIAFQLQDDILGLFGEEKTLGKAAGARDIKAGKVTLLIVKAFEKATQVEKAFLRKTYGQGKISRKEAERIKGIIEKTGSLDYSIQTMNDLVKKGKQAIPQITDQPRFRQTLASLADFMIKRQK